jgi:hypothetical protein
MGSLLNTFICIIHYSWANARGQLIILVISPCLYFYNYNSFYQEFILLNIFAFNLMQVVILNLILKNKELVRFLNFYNISNIVILTARLLFLYVFLLLHLVLFFTFSGNSIKNFFILNLLVLVFSAFKLVSWTLNRSAVITTIIFLFISQFILFLFTSSTIIIAFNILIIIILLALHRSRSHRRFT